MPPGSHEERAMDEQVQSLRQQVAAAEFLLSSLRAQLKEAETRAQRHHQPHDNRPGNAQRLPDANHITQTTDHHGGNIGPEASTHHSGLTFFGDGGQILDNTLVDGGGHASTDIADTNEENDNDAPSETSNNPNPPTAPLPPLEVGTTYPTLTAIKSATTAHALAAGWTCGVAKRDKTRLVLRCRSSPTCPFHLRAEQYVAHARISSYKPDHTCTFRSDQSHVPRAHATKLAFLREQVPGLLEVGAGTTAREISDAVFARFGTRVSLKQCRSLRVGARRARDGGKGRCGECGGVGHNRKTCGRVVEGSP